MTRIYKPSDVFLSLQEIPSGRVEFENCEFTGCVFTDISKFSFINCVFKNCNLSNCKMNQSKLQGVSFLDCKLLGVNFYQAKDFAFEIYCEKCMMDYASFDSKKMNKSRFVSCRMREVNWSNADLTKCTLRDCDLYESIFSETNLSGVDLTDLQNFSIDPELNNLKKARIRSQDLERLLYKHDLIIE